MSILGHLLLGAGLVGAWSIVSDAPFDQQAPTIATTATGFVVAWQDNRNLSQNQPQQIYACRLDNSGRLIDTAGIRLSSDSEADDAGPKVSASDSHCLVIWHRGC